MRAVVLSLCLIGAMAIAADAPAAGPTVATGPVTRDGWYDAGPWLSWLRPGLRSSAALIAGVSKVEDLVLYDLDVKLDADRNSFTLREVVYLTNESSLPRDEWVFRLYSNVGKAAQPLQVPVWFGKGRCIDSECSVLPEGPTIVTVRPRAPVPSGGRIKVSLELTGTLEQIEPSRTNLLAQGMEGLAALAGASTGGSYGLLAESNGVISLANFYPVLARRHGTIWDRGELLPIGDLGSDDLANVHAVLDLPSSFHLAHNGVVLGQQVDERSGRQRVEIGAAMVRDFVLLAGSELTSSSTSVGGVVVSSHYRKEDRAAGLSVLDVTAHALAQFERRFGPYPYQRLEIVEAPLVGGAGGVEFSGLATVASMFYDPKGMMGLSVLPTDGAREFITAHEVAHQWWHALIGSDSRDSPFTDESLAQYSAVLYLEDRYGRARAKHDTDTNVTMNYRMMRLLGEPDGRVDGTVASFKSALAYGGLVYGKGPHFFGEARKLLGDQAFFRALHAYVDHHRFRTAPPGALVDALADGTRASQVRTLAHRWLEESNGDRDLGAEPLSLSGLLGSKAGDPNLEKLLHELANELPGSIP